jgi:hypothetical protein
MNAKKWWAIPLMVIGVLGAVAGAAIELTSGYPINARILIAIALSFGINPVVWVGVGGFFLWRSGSKQQPAASHATAGELSRPYDLPSAPASIEQPPAATGPTGQRRVVQGWLLGLGAVALVGGGVLAGYLLFSDTGFGDQTASAAGTTLSTAMPSAEETSTTSSTTTSEAPSVPAEPTWGLAEFDGSVRPEGTISEAWTRDSIPYEQYFAQSETFTIGGTPGFRIAVGYGLEETGDWWLLGFVSEDEYAWTVMDFMATTTVLRHSLVSSESIGMCWATEQDAPVVAAVESADDGNVTRVIRAWTIPSWYGDGIWVGLDPALLDPSDVQLQPSPDVIPDCLLQAPAAAALDTGSDSNTQTTIATTEIPPSVRIYCPDDFSYPNGYVVTVTFDEEISLGSAAEATFEIDYGDGKSYTSPDVGHAERNMFWHDYTDPGVFTAVVRMTADNGLEASDSCSFAYNWTTPPPTTVPSGSGPISGGLGGSGFDAASCTYDGIPLYGNVKVVDYLADVDVRVVDYLADIRVQPVDYLANSCGQWKFVDYLPDFTIRYVDYLGDIDIQFVDYLPGT